MCLYPRLIKNRKYTPNKKNGGNIPPIHDERTKYVPIGCGNCIECRKKKAREWQVRLLEDIKTNKNGKFITLTFSNESIKEIAIECKGIGYDLDNEIATKAMRLFLERWRKQYKKSLRHWIVTELGHNGTENIHMHGIIWTNEPLSEVERIWSYGFVWKGKGEKQINYVNEQTVNYIIKYVNKADEKHPNYKSRILTSPGIGNAYVTTLDSAKNLFKNIETNETYRTRTGHKITLPIYWRNKIYTEDEREKLWLQKLDKDERWVCGEKVKNSDTKNYLGLLKHYRQLNKQLGYGNDEKNYEQEIYERERRIIMQQTRIKNAKNKK